MGTPRKRTTAPVRAAALLAAAVLSATGCSGQETFEVADLCGTKADPALVAPFLPEGDELKVDDSLSKPGQPRCKVSVDGTLHLYLRGDIVEPDFDPLEATEQSMRRLGNPAPADGIGDGATIADHGAMAVRACTHQGEKRQYVLDIDAVDHPQDTPERRRALERFVRAQLPVAMEAEGCRP